MFRAILLSALCLAAAARAQTSPPNVLFLSVDDLNTAVGFLSEEPGNPLQMLYPDPSVRAEVRAVLTPNLDRLAAEGIAFSNAHTSSAICAPSRAALMSGVRTSTSEFIGGEWFRENEVLAPLPMLPEHFKANGYFTAGMGKIYHRHVVEVGADGELLADMPDTQRSWTQWLNRHIGRKGRTTWSPWSPGEDYLRFGSSVSPVMDQHDGRNGEIVATLLETGTVTAEDVSYREPRTITLPEGAPFFLALGLYRPHVPLVAAEEMLALFDPDDIAFSDSLWNALLADAADVSDAAKARIYYEDGAITDGWTRQLLDHALAIDSVSGPTTAWKEFVRHYLASVAQSDRIVGRVLDALDAGPYADNTIVVVWGDHGWQFGEKMWFGKEMLWDESTRTPLLFRLPGAQTAPGDLRRQPVSLVDVYPTLAALAGLPVPSHLEGEDLAPLFADPAAPAVSTPLTSMGRDDHALVTPSFRYIRMDNSLAEEELYDVRVDPEERVNLVADPAYAADLESLRATMNALLGSAPPPPPPPTPTDGITITGEAGYRFLTVGVEGMTVEDLAEQNLVAGIPGQFEAEPLTLQTYFDGRDWQAPASLVEPLVPGQGLWWYFRDEDVTPPGAGVGASVALPFTLTGDGFAITSDVDVTLHGTGSRFNALGNPFNVPLDLRVMDTWDGAEWIQHKAFLWDDERSSWTIGRTVPPWTGFAVRATRSADGETLTIPYPWTAPPVVPSRDPRIAFELVGSHGETGRPLHDGAFAVRFTESAHADLDDLDVEKLAPLSARSVAVGARVGDVLLAEDARPLASTEVTVGLASVGAGADLTLQWSLEYIPAEWILRLEDLATGLTVDLRDSEALAFQSPSAPASAASATLREMDPETAPARFVIRVDTGLSTGAAPPPVSELALLPVAPNPARGTARVTFDLPAAGEAAVSVYDARGREVARLAEGYRDAGRHTVAWESARLAPGVYLVRLAAAGDVRLRRAVVVR